ncbi:hypothetical protein MCHI_000762 [Candidatus Magnetoovum chiemensis]|nr:hypothetical protein MCHI_000762 [Candidatus Magnetoovum chiemensis]
MYTFEVLAVELLKTNTNNLILTLEAFEKKQLERKDMSNKQRSILYKYLFELYIKLFHTAAKNQSFTAWLMMRLSRSSTNITAEFPAKDSIVIDLKYEITRIGLILDKHKHSFNCLHNLILQSSHKDNTAAQDNAYRERLIKFVETMPGYEIERYFKNFRKSFFKRHRNYRDMIKILVFYKKLEKLPQRVKDEVEDVLKQWTAKLDFPIVIRDDYIIEGDYRDHGMFITMKAYNTVKGFNVILRCIPIKYKRIHIGMDNRLTELAQSNPFLNTIYNIHRNKRWIVQVENYIDCKSIAQLVRNAAEGGSSVISIDTIKSVLLKAADFINTNAPLWFMPNIHPSCLFWDGKTLYFAAVGLSKLEMDKIILKRRLRSRGKSKNNRSFTAPEFIKKPNPHYFLSNKERFEQLAVYLLGLLAYYMFNHEFQANKQIVSIKRLKHISAESHNKIEDLINAALSPADSRAPLSEFYDIINKTDTKK